MDGVSDVQQEEAAELLVTMLNKAPALAGELSELLGALDDGESVVVDGVRDATLREQLSAFLTALGLASPPEAGDSTEGPNEAIKKSREFRCSIGGGGVLRMVAALMDERGLAQPPPMDEDAAFHAAKKVVDGLAQQKGMESVCEEVPVLLHQILGGEVVMLQGLEDTKIRDALTELFVALGLKSREVGVDGESGFGIPDTGGQDSEHVIKKVITSYGGRIDEGGEEDRGSEIAVEGEKSQGPADTAPRRGPIGPAMPSAAVLAQAQQAAAEFALQESSSDEDEDQVGPAVAGKEKRVASLIPAAGSAKRQRRAELERAAKWENVTGVMKGSQAALDKEDEDSKGREEWMLVPPKSLGVLGAIKTAQPTNRKFQTRSARGARAELHAPKAPKSKAELEAEAAAEELMARHREWKCNRFSKCKCHMCEAWLHIHHKRQGTVPSGCTLVLMMFSEAYSDHEQARGASLVDRHKMDGDKKAKKAASAKGGEKKSFSWSREEDFEQRRRFTPQMYEELVQKSRDLDTKFSRSVSRNFL